MLITGKKQYARRKRISSCFFLVASRNSFLDRGGRWGYRFGMSFEAGELSLLGLDKGTNQRLELSLGPCSTNLLKILTFNSFGSNMAVLSASKIEATERKDFPSVGHTCAVRASKGRTGKCKVPSCVTEMVVSSDDMTVGPFLVRFVLSTEASVFR